MSDSFAAAINCIDGRVQDPVATYMKNKFGVTYVDVITEPGVDKVLSSKNGSLRVSNLKERLMTSVKHHGAEAVCVAGHHNCAGNPAGEEEHLTQIRESVCEVQSWVPALPVIGLWVGGDWIVREVTL